MFLRNSKACNDLDYCFEDLSYAISTNLCRMYSNVVIECGNDKTCTTLLDFVLLIQGKRDGQRMSDKDINSNFRH